MTAVKTIANIILDSGGTNELTVYTESCEKIYSKKLTAITPQRIDTLEPFGQQSNPTRPTHYVEWKDWLQLYPIPDDTYIIKIRYFKWNAYDDDTTVPEIDHIDDIIIKAAAIHVWEILGEPEQANIMRQAVEVALAKCGKLERMKPDLVLKPRMGSIALSNEVSQSDPFIFSQG